MEDISPSPQTSQSPSVARILKNQALRHGFYSLGSLVQFPEGLQRLQPLWLAVSSWQLQGMAVVASWTGKGPSVSQTETLPVTSHVALGSWFLAPACPSTRTVEPLAHRRVSRSGSRQHSGLERDIACGLGTCFPPICNDKCPGPPSITPAPSTVLSSLPS